MEIDEWNKQGKIYGLRVVKRWKYHFLLIWFILSVILLIIFFILIISILNPFILKGIELYKNNSESINNYAINSLRGLM